MKNKIILLFIVTTFIKTFAFAGKYPRGCEVKGFGYNENFLILNDEGQQTFYLINNQSEKTIKLKRFETRDVFMSPTLETKLDAGNWAAFAADIENLHFNCFLEDNNTKTETEVSCQELLDICQYPRVKFALSNMGNYWVSTNKSQSRVIKDAIAKGILLRW